MRVEKKDEYMVICHNPQVYSPVLPKAEAERLRQEWSEAGIECEVVEAAVGRALRRDLTQSNTLRTLH